VACPGGVVVNTTNTTEVVANTMWEVCAFETHRAAYHTVIRDLELKLAVTVAVLGNVPSLPQGVGGV
jgi:hypothetical protein